MSKTKKLRPADRHITRAECQALFVHMMNEVFGKLADRPEELAAAQDAAYEKTTITVVKG